MKKNYLLACIVAFMTLQGVSAQQITTPGGQPLIVGNNGLRLSSINSSSTPQAANGVGLSVNGSGDIILVPSGGGGQWSVNSSNLYYQTGNVGIGLSAPAYKLDVNGDLNVANGSSLRFGGLKFIALGTTSVYIGKTAGPSSTGDYNLFVGNGAGATNSTGAYNFFGGSSAGFDNTTGSYNTFVGVEAGRKNTTGTYNLFLSQGAGYSNTTGSQNFYLGSGAGFDNQTGFGNVFIGVNAGRKSSVSYNVFVGNTAGYENTTGQYNMFVGSGAGYANQTGSSNLFFGYEAGRFSTASNNIFIGKGAGYANTTGSGNVFLGSGSGDNNTDGANNTLIGNNARLNSASLSNAMALGANAVVAASNALVLGNGANVGIGVSAPSAKLEVKSGTTGSSGLKFSDLTSATPGTIVTATRFLTVDANGNVVLGSTSGLREGASFSENWKLDASTKSLSNSNGGAVVIGEDRLRLPGSYRLFVQEGILTERVKVALRDTDDWSDKVFTPSYRLRGLNEVEQFIQEKGHLPGVPSAVEMVKSGNDLHKTDAVLLEKIEELTLYMIELKKENEKLRKEVDQLKRDTNK